MLKNIFYCLIVFFSILDCKFVLSRECLIDKVAFIVNDQIILDSDISNMMNIIKMQTKLSNNLLLKNDILRDQAIKYLINNRLLLFFNKNYKINISNYEIINAILSIVKKLNITFKKFKYYLSYYHIDYDIYLKIIKEEVLISKILNLEVSKHIFITYEEFNLFVDNLYSKYIKENIYNLRCFFIPLSENYSKKELLFKQNLSNEIFYKLKYGISFKNIEKIYVHNLNLAKIILFKYKKIQTLPTIFEKFLVNSKIGDIINPIKSDVGFYIINVQDLFNKNKSLELKEFYIRHIFIPNSFIENDCNISEKLLCIKKKIKSGIINFDNAIKMFSMDNKFLNEQNGYSGWFKLNNLDKKFRTSLMNLNIMQISNPIRSSNGWHLIQLLNVRLISFHDTLKNKKNYYFLYKNKYFETENLFMMKMSKSSYIKKIN